VKICTRPGLVAAGGLEAVDRRIGSNTGYFHPQILPHLYPSTGRLAGALDTVLEVLDGGTLDNLLHPCGPRELSTIKPCRDIHPIRHIPIMCVTCSPTVVYL
jgi:hypothetical protein